MTDLLIIRGRPGAGKSTVTELIQKQLSPQRVAIFTPDYFYWQVFPGEDNKHLVNKVLNFAIQEYLKNNYLVILEGILPKSENGKLFEWLKDFCKKRKISFSSIFMEIPLSKALERNRKRTKGEEISNKDMKTWYEVAKPNEIENEKVIKTDNKDPEQLVNEIINSIKTP